MTNVEAVRAVASLDDPHRARLHAFVQSAEGPVTREDAAAAVGISRNLAAFHLDRLVDAGLLTATFERPPGEHLRTGRAPKRYRTSDVQLVVSIPERRYDVVGEILLDAVSEAHKGEAPAEAVSRLARQRGREVGERLRSERRLGRVGPERGLGLVADVMAELGFEPLRSEGGLVQRNCPFHRLAVRSPAVVCAINRDFIDGLLQGFEIQRLRAELSPAEGRCCVVVTAI